jgi:RNA polymerase sigma-70 factor (ECF subfamily)
MTSTLDRELTGPTPIGLEQLEAHRRELTTHCRRMLGSAMEAEDAVQETLVRAWRALDRFEGRASLRSWLYRIATNVCLDMMRWPQRRARPAGIGPSAWSATGADDPGGETSSRTTMATTPEIDPSEQAVANDTVRQAFTVALQHLPSRQRAVLILRDVLRWQASEVAELLGASVPSVNSALQRARATLAANQPVTDDPDHLDLRDRRAGSMDREQSRLLGRYVDAFGRADVDMLVDLLHGDATPAN